MKTPKLDPNLQQFLRPGPVLKCYEVLKNDNLCLWIDTVKPRVFTLFAFGAFGPFQNLLYNPDSIQLQAGHWGIYPYSEGPAGRSYPFQNAFREADGSNEFVFEPDEIKADYNQNTVALKGAPAFAGQARQAGKFDWDIRLDKDRIALTASGVADATGFKLWLYPLYDWADLDGRKWPLGYQVAGWGEAKTLALTDSRNRLPRLRFEAPGGSLRVRSSLDNPHGGARCLEVESFGQGQTASMILRVLPNATQVSHSFIAIPDAAEALGRMANAVCTAVDKTAQAWPAVAGVVPNTCNLETLAPHLREENYAACAYMPRTAMLMCAAALETGNRRYLDVIFGALEKYRAFYKFLPDGRIGYPMAMSPVGVVQDDWKPDTRPSDYAIAARGYFYCADAYAKLNDPARSKLALERAKDLGLALAALQGPDGSFSSRYSYENPRWTRQGVAVNNVSWVLWQLYERLSARGDAAAGIIRDCALKYVAFELDQRLGPSALRVPGPGTAESIPMYHDDFVTVGCHLLVRHLATGDPQYAELAKQASAGAVFAASNFYIDQPEAFAFPISQGKLPLWLGGVCDTVGKGGMQDKSGNDLLLALAGRLRDPLSAQALQWRWYSRLAWSLEPSGAMNNMDINVPGYRFRNTEWAEELNWGGVGFAAHLLVNYC